MYSLYLLLLQVVSKTTWCKIYALRTIPSHTTHSHTIQSRTINHTQSNLSKYNSTQLTCIQSITYNQIVLNKNWHNIVSDHIQHSIKNYIRKLCTQFSEKRQIDRRATRWFQRRHPYNYTLKNLKSSHSRKSQNSPISCLFS